MAMIQTILGWLLLWVPAARAFVVPRIARASGATISRFTECCAAPRTGRHPTMILAAKSKNAVDEILDALDTMLGVSPLAETDLKPKDSPSAASSTTQMMNAQELQQRADARQREAPPSDALQKPSVAIFFTVLGLLPCVAFLTAVLNGFRPFGL